MGEIGMAIEAPSMDNVVFHKLREEQHAIASTEFAPIDIARVPAQAKAQRKGTVGRRKTRSKESGSPSRLESIATGVAIGAVLTTIVGVIILWQRYKKFRAS